MSSLLPQRLYALLRCPTDHGSLENRPASSELICLSCGASFPIRNGVPVLIDPSKSLFSTDRLMVDHHPPERVSLLKRLARTVVPDISLNVGAEQNYARLRKLLLQQCSKPLVLIAGPEKREKGLATC